jgi:hypothetical protein
MTMIQILLLIFLSILIILSGYFAAKFFENISNGIITIEKNYEDINETYLGDFYELTEQENSNFKIKEIL